MNNLSKSLLVICVLLIIALVINSIRVSNLKLENQRTTSNQNELLSELDINKQLVLTLKETILHDSAMIDEVVKKLNIKPKQITNVTNVYNTYIDSSKHVVQGQKINDSIVFIDYTQNDCWGFNGNFNLSTYRFTLGLKYFNDTTRIVDYWKRNRIFNAKYFWPRWGSKKYFRESYSKCGGDVKTEKITIKKR